MILKLIHKIGYLCVEVIFPRICFACKKPGNYLCSSCRASIPSPPLYQLNDVNPVIAAAPYHHSGIKKAIRQLKYRRGADIKEELANLLTSRIPSSLVKLKPDVVSIPLTEKRRRWRGFNQAEELAKCLAQKLNLPFCDGLLKIRETIAQTSLKNRSERLKNLEGAFAVNPGYSPKETILLVDDISTTGATLNEAGRILKQAGAKTVIGVIVAKG